MTNCRKCPVAEMCHYPYKPTDCFAQRKFMSADDAERHRVSQLAREQGFAMVFGEDMQEELPTTVFLFAEALTTPLKEEIAGHVESQAAKDVTINMLQDRIADLELENSELRANRMLMARDCALWYAEFGEPSSGDYAAAFVDEPGSSLSHFRQFARNIIDHLATSADRTFDEGTAAAVKPWIINQEIEIIEWPGSSESSRDWNGHGIPHEGAVVLAKFGDIGDVWRPFRILVVDGSEHVAGRWLNSRCTRPRIYPISKGFKRIKE